MNISVCMAFDFQSVRTVDADGRLHIAVSNISKATINPYYGREIPDSELLNLDPNRIYMLLRDPEELANAADTFNNIPLLSKHIPVTAAEPQKEFVVGSTGTDAQFAFPYLRNSLVVWDAQAIAGISSEAVRELSCAYRYDADMTPGEFEGVPYDGVMRNIRGNHVALVEVGRAGPDVYVFDHQPTEQTMKRTQVALAVAAALGAFITPRLAQDKQLGDLAGAIDPKLRKKDIPTQRSKIAAIIKDRTKGKLANDAELSVEELANVINGAATSVNPDEDDAALDDADDPCAQIIAMIKKLGPEDMAKVKGALNGATDEPPAPPKPGEEKKDDKVEKSAMDAAIAAANAETVKRMQAIRQAEREVAPFVGEVVAQDSAEAVYKLALDQAGVDLDGVHPSAYRALVQRLPKPGETAAPVVAQDSGASSAQFQKLFPDAVIPGRL